LLLCSSGPRHKIHREATLCRREQKLACSNSASLFLHFPLRAATTSQRKRSATWSISGVISTSPDGVITGTAGADKTHTEANAAARACALLHLAMLKRHLGSLDAVKSVVTVNGYVNAVPGFPDSPAVINGASDLFIEIFGESGRHVRAAIGVPALPRNALVELQTTVEI